MARSALVSLSLLAGCQAWGPDGHTIVAHIAEKLLDPKVQDVLSNDLGKTSLSEAATWCDDFDHTTPGRWSEPLHYINYPGHACSFDWERDCKDDICNAGAVLNYSAQVFDRATSKEARFIALKFVIHMVGDMHQPLHVASADDRGGNDIKVESKFAESLSNDGPAAATGVRLRRGHSKHASSESEGSKHGSEGSKHGGKPGHKSGGNLHRVWDSTIIEEIIKELTQEQGENFDQFHNWQVLSNFLYKRLEGDWSANLTEWRRSFSEDSGVGGEGVDAAVNGLSARRNEALLRAGLSAVASKTARIGCDYAYVQEDGTRIKTGDTLGRDYYEWVRPTVEAQLAKAGARLAQLLSDSLANSGERETIVML